MRAQVSAIDEASLPRCAQLIAKTNQFNLTTRRHGIEEIRRLAALPGAVALTLRVADRFGDHGLVSVLIAVPRSSSSSTPLGSGNAGTAGKPKEIEDEEEGQGRERYALRVDTWLMSCRVIGRSVEEFMFNALLARARELGYVRILGEYIPTAKNTPVKDLYDRLGFARQAEAPDGTVAYALDVAAARPAHTLVAGS
jgi:predicted enzyme involved in methoxymalonyl-ACP biosynthesis